MSEIRHVKAGQVWEFVAGSGEVVEYVVEDAEGVEWAGIQSLSSYVKLANPVSGGYAHVSVHWLHRDPSPTGSHWRFKAEAPEELAA